MAGRLGLAAKLFLGTTLLGGGGSGAWYATTHGLPPALGGSSDVAAAEDDANLEAVANAWGEESAPAPETASDDFSPIARSANVEPSETPEAAAPKEDAAPIEAPPVTDRYAVVSTPEPSESTEPSAAEATVDEPEAIEKVAAEETAPAEAETATAAEVDELVEVDAAPSETETVARGQAPSETPAASNSGRVDDEFADVPSTAAATQSNSVRTANDRARDAFGDSAAAPQTAVDRYGAAPSGTATAADASKRVNPFGGNEQAGAATAAEPGRIQPLAGQAGDVAGQLTELQQDIPQRTPTEPARIDRGSLNSDVDHFGGSPEPIPSEGPTPRVGTRSEFPSNRDSLTGEAASAAGPEVDGTGKPGERALEGAQRPALEIQKFAPAEIQVGKTAKFVVQVRNVGTQAAEGVTIRDQVPEGTRLVSTTPTAETSGSEVIWQLDKLSPGEDRAVEMILMPTGEGELGSVATVSYSAHASVKTKCTMPQLAIRMTAPAKVMIGQQQHVKIELRNPGSGDATGVMLFENVPQNVKHAAGPALEFEIGTLKAGETRELDLVLTAEKAGKTVNVLSAKADGNLQVQQQVEFEVVAPELTVDVNGPERRYLERPATYEVSVENPGTAPAHDVQIVTKLPKGMRFVRANNMGEYDASTHAVYWSLAELPEGEKGTVQLVAMPTEAGPQTIAVESRAGQGLSDETQRQIVVDGLAAIMFEVKDLEDPIEVGGETGYEIRVVNQGTKAASNVQVAIKLPAGMQVVSAEGETQHVEQQGAVVFEPLAQLAAKADTVYRVHVKGTAAGDQRVTVEVNTDDLAQPIRREESTTVFGDE